MGRDGGGGQTHTGDVSSAPKNLFKFPGKTHLGSSTTLETTEGAETRCFLSNGRVQCFRFLVGVMGPRKIGF